MNPGVMAINRLVLMGYRPLLEGEEIILKWGGLGQPDLAQVRLLAAQVWEYKMEVIDYLARKPQPPERVLTCAGCPHFSAYPGPNPQQAWGRCLKRGRGRYGCATACKAALTDDVLGV